MIACRSYPLKITKLFALPISASPGELDEAAVYEKKRFGSLGKHRCEQDLRKHEGFDAEPPRRWYRPRYRPPRSDVEICALRYLVEVVNQVAKNLAERAQEYEFVIYRAQEVRDKFEAARDQLLKPEFQDKPPVGFFQRLVQSVTGEDRRNIDHWSIMRLVERDRSIIGDFPATFDFFWSEYMRFQLETDEFYYDEPNAAVDALRGKLTPVLGVFLILDEERERREKLSHMGKVF